MKVKKGNYKNLVIVGNGFDLWQNLPTSYEKFRLYYYEHIERIIKELGCETFLLPDSRKVTPVELVYGDPFHLSNLDDRFFWSFENALAMVDDQRLLLFFGKKDAGLIRLQDMMNQAKAILQKAFSEWIAAISIDSVKTNFVFHKNCYFINFNYTHTLEKRFGIDETAVYHIHGEADDPESIIFGHATHPELPFPELMEQKMIHTLNGSGRSKRLEGLYLIESVLYETDKHVMENIDDLCYCMSLEDVHIEDIEDIFVVGHSFGEQDFEYFDFLNKVTQKDCDLNAPSALWQVNQFDFDSLNEDRLLEFIMLNIRYATHHRKRACGKSDIPFPKIEKVEREMFGDYDFYSPETARKAADAVHKRFLFEQAIRTKDCMEDYLTLVRGGSVPESAQCGSILKLADYLDGGHAKRESDAKWHISYYSEADRLRIINVMRKVNCNNYTLYPSIEACLKRFYK